MNVLRLGATVRLPAMQSDTTDVTCRSAYVAMVESGYLLERDGEFVQIMDWRPAGQGRALRLVRGFGGRTAKAHPAADWTIVDAPLTIGPGSPPVYLEDANADITLAVAAAESGARSAQRANCKTCGAPDQRVGERCHYCIRVVTA